MSVCLSTILIMEKLTCYKDIVSVLRPQSFPQHGTGRMVPSNSSADEAEGEY